MVKQKIAVIGASHGGHEVALELLTQSDAYDVTVFEAGDFISFMSCGMELYLTEAVQNAELVRNFKPSDLEKYGGHVRNNAKVTGIDATNHTLTINNQELFTYDKAVLSVGVTPAHLTIPGSNLANIIPMRGYDWAKRIKQYLNDATIKDVTVIGAGYIGIEAVEALVRAGKNVTVLDMLPRVLAAYLDADMTDIITQELIAHGVNVKVGEAITAFEGSENEGVTAVVTDQGTYATDLVIEGIGVTANTAPFADTLALDKRGWIETTRNFETNLPDVYAIGDAVKPYYIPTGQQQPVALASTARREAQYVAQRIMGNKHAVDFKGVVGASALKVFDYTFASSGLNSVTADRSKIKISAVTYTDTRQPAFVPTSEGNGDIIVRLAFNPDSRIILGGAIMARDYDVTGFGNTLALAIAQKMTVDDLAEADFFFQPGFDRQWSVLNLAAQKACHYGEFTK